MTSTAFDLAGVRARFPALAREQDGRRVVFLDGPGGAQLPATVIDAMAARLRGGTANDGGVFATTRETAALVGRARAAAALLTGSGADEIAFGANMTTLNFLLAHAVARTLERGDEIVVTELDHDANVAPWLRVAEDHGLVVRTAPVDRATGALDVAALLALLGDRTRVVAVTAASNATGEIVDVPRIAAAAHAVGALVWVDAVHLAPHRRPDRRALGADVLLCSPYKFFGPHLGLASIRADLAASWPADRVRPAAEEPAGHRFETGTTSFEALAGFVAAVDHLLALGDLDLDVAYDRIRAHEDVLCADALARLLAVDGLTLYGPRDVASRTATFCFTVDGVTPRRVTEHLASRGVFAWDGNYYALGLMEALGLEGRGGAVRAGFLHYHGTEDVDRLLEALGSLT